jgi:hypothetical protein
MNDVSVGVYLAGFAAGYLARLKVEFPEVEWSDPTPYRTPDPGVDDPGALLHVAFGFMATAPAYTSIVREAAVSVALTALGHALMGEIGAHCAVAHVRTAPELVGERDFNTGRPVVTLWMRASLEGAKMGSGPAQVRLMHRGEPEPVALSDLAAREVVLR